MARDPITLVIALDRQGQASGELYVDDGRSFAFQVGMARLLLATWLRTLAGRQQGPGVTCWRSVGHG